jgi:hypothetical protein
VHIVKDHTDVFRLLKRNIWWNVIQPQICGVPAKGVEELGWVGRVGRVGGGGDWAESPVVYS